MAVPGVLLLTIVAVTFAIYAYRRHHAFKHFRVHDAARLYRSGWVESYALSELIPKYGIRTVVNLCESGEMGEDRWTEERRTATRHGATVVHLSMPFEPDVDHPVYGGAESLLADESAYPMLVHCRHGVTRTAKFVAMYDVLRRGIPIQESLAAMPLFGRRDHHPWVHEFVRRYESDLSNRQSLNHRRAA